jgi:hypothetical protein
LFATETTVGLARMQNAKSDFFIEHFAFLILHFAFMLSLRPLWLVLIVEAATSLGEVG